MRAKLQQILTDTRFGSVGDLVHARVRVPGRITLADPLLSELVQSAEGGDAVAARQLFSVLYDELQRMAQRELQRMGGGLTLGANTLLHETYMKMARREGMTFPDRARFMAYAARAMRGLIIDYARRRHAQKRGGAFEITTLPTNVPDATARGADDALNVEQLERLAAAVDRLALLDPELAQLVDLKYFAGMSFVEIAAMRNVTERTVYRHWEKARIFLYRTLNGQWEA